VTHVRPQVAEHLGDKTIKVDEVPRHDLKELGEHLDAGTAGLIVVAVSDMGAKVERAMKRASKLEQRELKADNAEIERDAASAS
jgi:hypothetical protein